MKKDYKDRMKGGNQVFTPPKVVSDMLDMLDEETWTDTRTVYYEPSFGDGAFLVQLIERSYHALKKHYGKIENKKNQAREIALSETVFKMTGSEIDESLVFKTRMRCIEKVFDIAKKEKGFNFEEFSRYLVASAVTENLKCEDFFVRFTGKNLDELRKEKYTKKRGVK